ncbi:MAG: MFS transporter [Deltaproteobacteria bacterium]|nr:MAG: MFS transporter [Deltaproteobacteria bacterium]
MLFCVLSGFSSGLPLYVLYQMVPAWLRDRGVDLGTIGLFSLISFPYTWKFAWSPLMDRVALPLGRRRGWALLTQGVLFAALAALSAFDAGEQTRQVAAVAFIVALFSASQDIVLDAWRREVLPDRELGLGNSVFVNAYRISSLVPGSLALILADHLPWSQVIRVVAAFMVVGILTTLWMPEPRVPPAPTRTLAAAVLDPFREFFRRNGLGPALLILLFMLLYKLGDSMATALSTPFYLDTGFTKTQVGSIAKAAALWSSITGGIVGGLIMVRAGINRSLWLFGVVQIVSILGFWLLAVTGPNEWLLFAVVSFEYLGVGMGTAAFVAFIARSTHRAHTATQLALLTSLTGVPRTFANATTGYIVQAVGYPAFFLLCTAIALPGMLLLPLVAPWGDDPAADEEPGIR